MAGSALMATATLTDSALAEEVAEILQLEVLPACNEDT